MATARTDGCCASDAWVNQQILSMVLRDNAKRGKEGQAKGLLLEPLTPDNSWLLFWIKWKDWPVTGRADEWAREEDLNCPVPVRYAHLNKRQARTEGRCPSMQSPAHRMLIAVTGRHKWLEKGWNDKEWCRAMMNSPTFRGCLMQS